MSEEGRNLWPPTLAPRTLRTPVSVLRRQAEELYQKTKGLLRGELVFDGKDANFSVSFNVVAPALGNYRFWILSVYQSAEGFPVTLKNRGSDPRVVAAENIEEFETRLAEILASRWVVENVSALWGESLGEG